ncbi:HAMP domain-containing protein, partial [Actinophytocola xanthii]
MTNVNAGAKPARPGRVSRLLADRSLATKILAAVALPAVVAVVVAVQGIGVAADGADTSHRIGNNVTALHKIEEMSASLSDATEAAVASMIDTDAATTKAILDAFSEHIATGEKRISDFQASNAANSEFSAVPAEVVQQLADSVSEIHDVVDQEITPLVQADNFNQALGIYAGKVMPLIDELDKLTEQMNQEEMADAAEEVTAVEAERDSNFLTALIFLVVGLGLAAGAALFIVRGITRPLREVSTVLDALAHGDLTKRVQVSSKDEVGVMATALNTATESMKETVSAISQGMVSLEASSQELSTVATQVAASAEETSAQAGV